jgi:hypothetical protein
MTGRQKKQGNQFPHSKKLVQETEGNEENKIDRPLANLTKMRREKNPN